VPRWRAPEDTKIGFMKEARKLKCWICGKTTRCYRRLQLWLHRNQLQVVD
jgi:hypothetical protein